MAHNERGRNFQPDDADVLNADDKASHRKENVRSTSDTQDPEAEAGLADSDTEER